MESEDGADLEVGAELGLAFHQDLEQRLELRRKLDLEEL